MIHNSLRENIRNVLQKEIIEGYFDDYLEINQVQLSKRFGTSRGPIREALAQLESVGLVEYNAYKKVNVKIIDKKYVIDLYNVRKIIEIFAIKELIKLNNKKIEFQLEKILLQMKEAIIKKNKSDVASLDLLFHRTIIIGTNNNFLIRSWEALEIGVMRCIHKRYKIYDSLEEVIGNHPLIIKHIINNDEKRAEDLISVHIQEALEKILLSWSNNERI